MSAEMPVMKVVYNVHHAEPRGWKQKSIVAQGQELQAYNISVEIKLSKLAAEAVE